MHEHKYRNVSHIRLIVLVTAKWTVCFENTLHTAIYFAKASGELCLCVCECSELLKCLIKVFSMSTYISKYYSAAILHFSSNHGKHGFLLHSQKWSQLLLNACEVFKQSGGWKMRVVWFEFANLFLFPVKAVCNKKAGFRRFYSVAMKNLCRQSDWTSNSRYLAKSNFISENAHWSECRGTGHF